MKIALFLFGEIRSGLRCSSSLKSFLPENANIDIFGSFWKTLGESSWKDHKSGTENIEKKFQKYSDNLSSFGNTKTELVERQSITSTYNLSDGFYTKNAHFAQVNMFNSIKNSIKLCEDISNYDLILITRPDVYFYNKLRLFSNDNIYLSGRLLNSGEYHAYDIIIQFTPEKYNPKMFEMYEIGVDSQSEFPWLKHLKSVGLKYNVGAYKWKKDFIIMREDLKSFVRAKIRI